MNYETHKAHKRKGKPLAVCLNCWLEYLEENPEAIITGKDLRRLLEAMNYRVLSYQVREMWRRY